MIKIDWTARGGEFDDSTRGRIEQQLQKLGRFLRGEAEAHVILTQEGAAEAHPRHTVEVVVRHRLGTFTAKQESLDRADATREVLDRVEAQAHKAHDKLIESRRKGGRIATEPAEAS